MSDPNEDQLLDDAGEVYADWRVAGHAASDDAAFEKLCVQQPMLATYLKRIRRLDAGARQVAREEGAASGGLTFGAPATDPNKTATAIGADDHRGWSSKETERKARAMMEKVRQRTLSFGKYHLTGLTTDWSQIGKGGAGSVYRAWDEDLTRKVALKLLHRRYVDSTSDVDPSLRRRAQARFVHEAQLTAQLDHPGIVPVHDFGVTSTGRPYFTMKMVKGKTLGHVIELLSKRSSTWTLTRTLGLFIKASEALAYAHDKGVIHRDLKPANIMVGKFGEVYVMDWGLLKRVEQDTSQASMAVTQVADLPDVPEAEAAAGITDQGDALGTATYMAPEQALGDLDAVGRWSDIYGLGAILYHILAGAAPFLAGGKHPRVLEIIEAHRSGKGPESIDEVAPRAPMELRRIVAKAMMRKPEDRYANVTEMSDELIEFIEGRVGKNWSSHPFRSAFRWVQHRPAVALLMGLTVLLGGLLLSRAFAPEPQQASQQSGPVPIQAAVNRWVQAHGEEGLPAMLQQLDKLIESDPSDHERLMGEFMNTWGPAK